VCQSERGPCAVQIVVEMNCWGGRWAVLAVLAATLGTYMLVGATDASAGLGCPTPDATHVTVNIHNIAYSPSSETISPGVNVCWTNLDGVTHTVTSGPDFGGDTSVWPTHTFAPGDSNSVPFSTLGTFPYHCNIHSSMHGTIVVENPPSAPTVSATTPASPSSNANPKVTGSGDTGSTIQLYTNSTCTQSIGTATAVATFENPGIAVTVSEGPTTFYAKASNAVGASPCSTSSVTYVLDTTAPSPPTVSGASGASPGSKTNPVISGDAEPNAAISIFSDAACAHFLGSTTAGSMPGTWSFVLPDDASMTTGTTETFYATATDAVGNASGCSTTFATYTAPSDGPNAQIISGPSGRTNDKSPSFGLFSSTPNTDFDCSIDQGTRSFSPCAANPDQVGPLADGDWIFAFKAVDHGDPSNDTIVTQSFTVDTVGPTITIASGPTEGSTSGPSPTFTYSNTDAHFDHYECNLDSGGFSACTSGAHLSLGGGPHSLVVHGLDDVGNPGTDVTRNWMVDATPPTIVMGNGSPQNGDTTGPNVSFTFSSPDSDLDRFECAIDAGSFDPCTQETASGLLDGSHTFTLHAFDAVGNRSSNTIIWNVDATPPDAPDVFGPTRTRLHRPSFTFTDTDPSPTYTCSLDGRHAVACATPYRTPRLALGRHTLVVTAHDAVGNASIPTTWHFRIVR